MACAGTVIAAVYRLQCTSQFSRTPEPGPHANNMSLNKQPLGLSPKARILFAKGQCVRSVRNMRVHCCWGPVPPVQLCVRLCPPNEFPGRICRSVRRGWITSLQTSRGLLFGLLQHVQQLPPTRLRDVVLAILLGRRAGHVLRHGAGGGGGGPGSTSGAWQLQTMGTPKSHV